MFFGEMKIDFVWPLACGFSGLGGCVFRFATRIFREVRELSVQLATATQTEQQATWLNSPLFTPSLVQGAWQGLRQGGWAGLSAWSFLTPSAS